jgi:hypothetical protein
MNICEKMYNNVLRQINIEMIDVGFPSFPNIYSFPEIYFSVIDVEVAFLDI